VIAWGTFEEPEGEEAESALKKLISQLMPLKTNQNIQPTHGIDLLHKLEALHLKATVYRIKIEEKTGRFEKR